MVAIKTRAKSKPPKLGDPVKNEIARNCLGCARFTICRDTRKAWNFACTRFAPMPELVDFTQSVAELRDEAAERAITKAAKSRAVAHRDESMVNLEQMVEDALSSGFGVPPDLRIDDRDLKLAPNFWSWLTDKRFMASDQLLFPKQIEIALHLLGEYCPRCSDNEFAHDIPFKIRIDKIWDRVVLLRNGKCPECGVTKSELVEEEELNEYYELAGVAGQRSGKTLLTSFIESYQIHRWVKSPNPQAMYRIMPQQGLMGTYVALTFAQAKENYFDTVRNYLEASPWFRAYHSMLDDYGEKYGEELYGFKETFIKYNHRNLFFAPSGPNKRTLRGRTRIAAGVDEMGWFPWGDDNKDKTKMSGDEVYKALKNSMTTMTSGHARLLKKGNDNIPKPLIVAISSPSEAGDMIMQLYNASEGNRYVYGFKYATWDFNPTLTKDDPTIASAFRLDPVAAMRDYGAEPPMSDRAFITEKNNVARCFGKRGNIVRLKQRVVKSKKTGLRQMTGDVNVMPRIRTNRVLCLDAGIVGNSFAMCTAYYDYLEDKVVIDGLAEIMSNRQAPTSMSRVYDDVLVPIAEIADCKVAVCDRWQSEKMLGDFENDLDMQPLKESLKYGAFSMFRDAVYDNKIKFPKLELPEDVIMSASGDYPTRFVDNPVSHLMYQILTVRDKPGKTVEKGSGSEDDLFRTVVLAYWALTNQDIRDMLGHAEPDRMPTVIGMVASGASPGSSRGSSMGAMGSRAGFGEGESSGTKMARINTQGGQARALGVSGTRIG